MFHEGWKATCAWPSYVGALGYCPFALPTACSDPSVDDDGDGLSEVEGDCCDIPGTTCTYLYCGCDECFPPGELVYPASWYSQEITCGCDCPGSFGSYDTTCGSVFGVCGNGARQLGEECDDGNLIVRDGCEPDCTLSVCVNPDGARDIMIKPKVALAKINADTMLGNDGLQIKGEFVLDALANFASLDPLTDGARIAIKAQNGASRVDVTIPGGAYDGTSGWRVNGSATKYSYRDKTKPGAHNGISKLTIQDRRKKAPNQVKIKGKGKGKGKGKDGSYPIISGDEPIRATVVLGDSNASVAGECGETAFGPQDCMFNGKGDKLTCKKQ